MEFRQDHAVSRPIRVALVFPGAVDGLGGAEVQAIHYLTRCDSADVEARLVLLGRNPTFEARVGDTGFAAVDILNPRNRHPWHPAVVVEYVSLLRRRAFDLVHLYGLRQEVVTRPATAHVGGIVIVSAIRGLESHRNAAHVALNRITSRWVDRWLSNSEESRDLFVKRDGLPRDRIDVVANGVDLPAAHDLARWRVETRRELGLDDGERVVICVANHLREKRIADLAAAVARVGSEGGRCKLIVAGRRAEDTPRIESAASRCGDRVMLLGYRSDIPRLLAAADVMALVSEKEGMPSSVLEGMAAGLPVIATPVASLVRLVRHGDNGFIVPVGDIAAITARIAELCKDAELAARLGARSRRITAEDYSLDRTVRDLTAVYLSLVRERKA